MDYSSGKTAPAGNDDGQRAKLLVQPYTSAPPGYNTLHSTQPVAVSSGCPRAERRPRRRACARVVHVFVVTLLICILFPVAVQNISRFGNAIRHLLGESENYMEPELPADCVQVAAWKPFDGHPDDHHYSHGAHTSLELPVSSDLLYVLTRGSLANGVLEITEGNNVDSDVVKVHVTFLYQMPEVLDYAKVCLLQKDEGKNGVGIFTRRWTVRPRNYRTMFHVHVQLPSAEQGQRIIKALETETSLFRHEIGDLKDSFHFDSVVLRTSNTDIRVKSLSGGRGSFRTSNAPIGGTFNSTDNVEFITSNAPINVEVNLANDGSQDKVNRLVAQTSNSPVSVDVSLQSLADGGSGGKFDVTVRTSNGPLNVRTISAPVDSILNLRGSSSNSVVRAKMHPTFEGEFSVHSSPFFGADVRMHEDQTDPAGKGRKRQLETRRVSKGVSEGKVTWSPVEERELGSITLTTSNSPAHLSL